MAGSALRRLMAEHKQLSQNPPDGLIEASCLAGALHVYYFRNSCWTEYRGQLLRVGGRHHGPNRDLLRGRGVYRLPLLPPGLSPQSPQDEVQVGAFPSEYLPRWASLYQVSLNIVCLAIID